MTLSPHRAMWPPDPPGAPVVGPGLGYDQWLRIQLFQRRTVVLAGHLDDATANAVNVALMTLDADGDGPVHLRIDSGDGSVACALAVMDVIDLLGVPVRASCTGQAVGPAVGVLAVCPHRTLAPHARLGLIEPKTQFHGSARQLEQLATAHLAQWSVFCQRVGDASGQPLDRLLDDTARGCFLSAEDAVAYGLADDIAAPGARITPLPSRPIGFGDGAGRPI